MRRELLLLAVWTVFAGSACSRSHPARPVPVTFSIHEGETRPACAHALTRADLVAPVTADTASWGPPLKVATPIATDCPEDDPEISDDGSRLYFYGATGVHASTADLVTGATGVYHAARVGGPGEFGTPVYVELRKGTSGAHDGHPRLRESEHLVYFHSTRTDNTGYRQLPRVEDPLDVYVADLTGHVASAARNLGAAVNSVHTDGEPEISPDGQTLYFASDRPGGYGGLDLYQSVRAGGVWSPAANLGPTVNTAANETQPAFAAGDPGTMYFVSDRNAAGMTIYRTRRSGDAWGAAVPVVRGQVGSPSLTADGGLLYFAHVQTDATPGDPVFGADLYYLVRR